MSRHTSERRWLAMLAFTASCLIAPASMAQTAAPSSAPAKAESAPAAIAQDAEIVDLACTVAKGGTCRPGEDCKPADRVGEEPLPLKITIDFDNRVVMSPVARGFVRSSRITMLASDQEQLMLHGIEHGFAWQISIHEKSRAMSLTVSSVRGAFVGFGACVSLEELQAKKN